jgi:hypothetical protein
MARKGGTPENLIPAKKGEVRNPKGRPPKLPNLDQLMAEILGEEKDGITAAQAILRVIRAKASKGDLRAAEVLFDRGYGKPKQAADITTNGKDINTLTISIVDD